MAKGPKPDPGAIQPELWQRLAPREREIYALFSQGQSNAEIAQQLGLKDSSVRVYLQTAKRKLGRRLDQPALPVPGEIEIPGARLPMGQMLALLEHKARLALQAMDRERFADAKLRDLSQTVKDLLTTRNLLLGEPTQIIRSEERLSLNEAVKLIVAEAQRRGLEIGTEPESGGVFVGRTIEAEIS